MKVSAWFAYSRSDPSVISAQPGSSIQVKQAAPALPESALPCRHSRHLQSIRLLPWPLDGMAAFDFSNIGTESLEQNAF